MGWWFVHLEVGDPRVIYGHLAPGGDTEEEKIRVDIMENQIMDFRMQLVRLCYNSNHVSFLI